MVLFFTLAQPSGPHWPFSTNPSFFWDTLYCWYFCCHPPASRVSRDHFTVTCHETRDPPQPIRGHCHGLIFSHFCNFCSPVTVCTLATNTCIKDDGWLPDSAIVSFNMIIVGFEKCLTIISNHSHAEFYCLQTRKYAVIILMTIPFHGDPCKKNIVSKMLK